MPDPTWPLTAFWLASSLQSKRCQQPREACHLLPGIPQEMLVGGDKTNDALLLVASGPFTSQGLRSGPPNP